MWRCGSIRPTGMEDSPRLQSAGVAFSPCLASKKADLPFGSDGERWNLYHGHGGNNPVMMPSCYPVCGW